MGLQNPRAHLNRLETFLGGMETPDQPAAGVHHPRLETFLGGMETPGALGRR